MMIKYLSNSIEIGVSLMTSVIIEVHTGRSMKKLVVVLQVLNMMYGLTIVLKNMTNG